MAKIDSAYDYYMATYANREVSRYDSHKKSDLRKVYNDIVKANKESPLYKIANVDDATKYAIDIKEHAKAIQNVVASLSAQYGKSSDAFQKKVAQSSDDENVSVKYVGDGNEENSAEQFSIEVDELATPQKNIGHMLSDNGLSFRPGSYSFDLNVGGSSYEFQYNVNPGETNHDVLTKLSNLVNHSKLGISAEIVTEGDASRLELTSNHTGLAEGEENLFSITPSASNDSMQAMNLLGIHEITEPAHNSSFRLNGTPHSSLSNTFTINNAFELTLNQATAQGASTTIGFKANADAVADNIQTLVDAYNSMISTAKEYADENSTADGNRLYQDLSATSRNRQAQLGDIGLIVAEDGSISIDRELLADAIEPNRAESTFQTLSNFRDLIGSKADNAAVNPMRYVNKVIVAYKNPGHNFNTPYISSIYSGMMLDSVV